MNKRVPAVVLGSGYGFLHQGVPKILESISLLKDRPMVAEVVSSIKTTVSSCLTLKPIILVVNKNYREVIINCLRTHGHSDCYFVIQPDRLGAGDAVRRAIPLIKKNGYREFLVIFADMPLWKPETIKCLVTTHLHEKPVISMVTVSLEALPQSFKQYGRILRGPNKEIMKIVEPADATAEQLRTTETINPSLYVFDLGWFEKNIHLVNPREKNDGFAPEIYLPPLVEIAYQAKKKILEVSLEDPHEALGVNTLAELEVVRRIIDE